MSDSHAAPVAATATEVSPQVAAEINKRIQGYIKIGAIQVVFSIFTVIVAFILTGAAKVPAVLACASLNATVVAAFMMHLKGEKQMIWKFLIFTGIFFFVLFGLTTLARTDEIMGVSHTHH